MLRRLYSFIKNVSCAAEYLVTTSSFNSIELLKMIQQGEVSDDDESLYALLLHIMSIELALYKHDILQSYDDEVNDDEANDSDEANDEEANDEADNRAAAKIYQVDSALLSSITSRHSIMLETIEQLSSGTRTISHDLELVIFDILCYVATLFTSEYEHSNIPSLSLALNTYCHDLLYKLFNQQIQWNLTHQINDEINDETDDDTDDDDR